MSKIDFDIVVEAEAVPLTDSVQQQIDPLKTGFYWYTPPLAGDGQHETSGHKWTISGHDMQVLTTTVPPGDQVATEVGSFMYMAPFMETEVELLLCSSAGFGEGCNRICGGESCVKVYLKNPTSDKAGYAGLTPNFPAKVLPIKFGTHVAADQPLIAQSGAYMSDLGEVDVGCDLDCSCATCCCAGLGCCRQKIEGKNGSIAFIAAGGTLVYRNLKEGETITVDTRSVVAFENSVTMGVTPNGRIGMCCCGGEGCFSTTLTGPGKIFMQSMSFGKFKDAIQAKTMDDRGETGGEAAVGLAASLA